MVRVLRYPRMFCACCAAAIGCALLRDACIGVSLPGCARVLLIVTSVMLALSLVLMSCRFCVDAQGVGVGFLFRMRYTCWEDLAAFGLVQCNSRRRYFYGMYRGATDFLNMLHHAPRCGSWGFVVPVNQRLMSAVLRFCPFSLDVSPAAPRKREGRLRLQWHHVLLYALLLIPASFICLVTCAMMLIAACEAKRITTLLWLTLGALFLACAALFFLRRLWSSAITCPSYNEKGVAAGFGLYLPWDAVRFGYVHRVGKISGMFLLSQPLDAVRRRGAPPVFCLSMPDTTTLLLAYLTYCPHASKGMDV